MASPFVELEVGEPHRQGHEPGQGALPGRAAHTKRDLVEYYLAVGDGIVRALRERPTQLRRFPDGIEGEQIYQKRVPEKRPEWVEAARVTFPSGRHADELCVTELAQVDLGGEPRGDRLPPVAVAARRRRPSRRAADRHRPAAGNGLRGRRSSVAARRARDARRDRLHGLAEDVRATAASTSPCRIEPQLGVPGRPPLRARLRAGDRAPRARARHDRVVEGGARREGLHRLQPERPRPHDRVGVLGARRGPTRPSRRRSRGTSCRTSRPRTSRSSTMPDAVREARRRAGRDRRRRLRPRGAARVGRARGGRGRRARRRTRRTSRRCPASRRGCSPRARRRPRPDRRSVRFPN